jgi:hypothetical protein
VAVRTVFVPCEVLPLKMLAVNVTLPAPKVIGSGVPLSPDRFKSIWELQVTEPLPLLLAPFESG